MWLGTSEQPPTLGRDARCGGTQWIDLAPDVRKGVVEVLREQNQGFGAGLDTFASLDRLTNGAAAIVTGQQVGLFTRASYSFYKAISAARFAEEVSRKGVEAVPIFWLATEDHDLAEINHAEWNTENGLARFEMPETEAESGRRVGEVKLGPGITALVAKAVESLRGGFAEDVARGRCANPTHPTKPMVQHLGS